MDVDLEPHPLLEAGVLELVYAQPVGQTSSPEWLKDLLAPGASVPLASSDEVRAAIRGLLRAGGFKPTGRSKPASEYLLRAVADGQLGSINLAVDLCNAVSLHSGLPISVVDLARARMPLRVGVAGAGASHVFNAAGQSIDLAGLLCLCDADGPCANAVKDAQRTKTSPETTRTLSVIWSTRALPGRLRPALDWYRELALRAGAQVLDCQAVSAPRPPF